MIGTREVLVFVGIIVIVGVGEGRVRRVLVTIPAQ
jgi:hypothetical protein